jgi:predicted nucleotidyltransferase
VTTERPLNCSQEAMMRRDEVLHLLQDHSDEVKERFGVRSLRLFGSVARDHASDHSDVDILVAFEDQPTFRGYMDLRIFLEDLLGIDVDLVTETGLKDHARSSVERDAIRVA